MLFSLSRAPPSRRLCVSGWTSASHGPALEASATAACRPGASEGTSKYAKTAYPRAMHCATAAAMTALRARRGGDRRRKQRGARKLRITRSEFARDSEPTPQRARLPVAEAAWGGGTCRSDRCTANLRDQVIVKRPACAEKCAQRKQHHQNRNSEENAQHRWAASRGCIMRCARSLAQVSGQLRHGSRVRSARCPWPARRAEPGQLASPQWPLAFNPLRETPDAWGKWHAVHLFADCVEVPVFFAAPHQSCGKCHGSPTNPLSVLRAAKLAVQSMPAVPTLRSTSVPLAVVGDEC